MTTWTSPTKAGPGSAEFDLLIGGGYFFEIGGGFLLEVTPLAVGGWTPETKNTTSWTLINQS